MKNLHQIHGKLTDYQTALAWYLFTQGYPKVRILKDGRMEYYNKYVPIWYPAHASDSWGVEESFWNDKYNLWIKKGRPKPAKEVEFYEESS